jgi:hypothetical protein
MTITAETAPSPERLLSPCAEIYIPEVPAAIMARRRCPELANPAGMPETGQKLI